MSFCSVRSGFWINSKCLLLKITDLEVTIKIKIEDLEINLMRIPSFSFPS